VQEEQYDSSSEPLHERSHEPLQQQQQQQQRSRVYYEADADSNDNSKASNDDDYSNQAHHQHQQHRQQRQQQSNVANGSSAAPQQQQQQQHHYHGHCVPTVAAADNTSVLSAQYSFAHHPLRAAARASANERAIAGLREHLQAVARQLEVERTGLRCVLT
jgi:hypothetical protein